MEKNRKFTKICSSWAVSYNMFNVDASQSHAAGILALIPLEKWVSLGLILLSNTHKYIGMSGRFMCADVTASSSKVFNRCY